MKLTVTDHDHPLATSRGQVGIGRHLLYAKYEGQDPKCRDCGTQLRWVGGTGRDAAIVRYANNDPTDQRVENLYASCTSCLRRTTSHQGIKDGEAFFVNKKGRRERAELRNCAECGGPFSVSLANLRTNPRAGKFCSGSCRSIAGNRIRWARVKGQQV